MPWRRCARPRATCRDFTNWRTAPPAARELRLGWPAPDNAQEAIDEAEFDLALLQKLIDADPETTVGAAHYLLNTNPPSGARIARARPAMAAPMDAR